MTLIPNWRKAPRMLSMWAYFLTICALIGVLQAVLSTGERPSYGEIVVGLFGLIVLQVMGALGRLVQQGLADDVAAVLGE